MTESQIQNIPAMIGPVSRLTPSSEAEWHALRARDVTASQIGALFGCHPFVSAFDLYLAKRDGQRHERETPAMRRGRLLEPVAVQMIREDRPGWILDYSTASMTYYRAAEARIGATPDVIAETGEGRAVIQIKTVSAYAWRSSWIDEDGAVEPPLWVAIQAEVERLLVRAERAIVAPLVIASDGNIDLPMVEVPRVDMTGAIVEAARDFWDRVEGRLPPPEPEYARDADAIDRAIGAIDPENEVDLSNHDEIELHIRARAEFADLRADSDRTLAEIDARIRHIMGSAEVAHLRGGRRITRPVVRREARVQIASESRPLRLPKPSSQSHPLKEDTQ